MFWSVKIYLKIFFFFSTLLFFILLWPGKMWQSCHPEWPFTLWFSASLREMYQDGHCLLRAHPKFCSKGPLGKIQHQKSPLTLNLSLSHWINQKHFWNSESLITAATRKAEEVFKGACPWALGHCYYQGGVDSLAFYFIKAFSVLNSSSFNMKLIRCIKLEVCRTEIPSQPRHHPRTFLVSSQRKLM